MCVRHATSRTEAKMHADVAWSKGYVRAGDSVICTLSSVRTNVMGTKVQRLRTWSWNTVHRFTASRVDEERYGVVDRDAMSL